MFRRSIIGFFAAATLAVFTTGCPSQSVVGVRDPIGTDVGKTPSVKDRLAANRARHLDMLHAYAEAGEFPRNEVMPEIANIFRDEQGHLCAVANMIQKDGGHDALIDRTVKENNLIRLADVHEGELYDWILTSGFTQEEIAMIQAPYMPPQRMSVEEERERVRERLKDAEARLRDDTDQSVGIAAQRFVRQRDAASVRWASN